MFFRDRAMATLKGEPTDIIPFIPRLDLWYQANKARGTLPSEYIGADLIDIVDDLGIGYHSIIPDYRELFDPLDDADRALGIFRMKNLPYRTSLKNVNRNITFDGDLLTVEYLTPHGNITTKTLYNDYMKRTGASISHVVETAIKNVDDFKAVAYIFESAEVEPLFHQYDSVKEKVGDRGIVVGFSGYFGSPMHLIQHELMPYDKFFYAYYENLAELEWLAEKISGYFWRVFEVAAQSPAEVILLGGNYDTQITWPPYFKEHISPTLVKAAEILHSKGKYLLTHTDGENKGLLPMYLDCNIDIADSICPTPMTTQSLKDIRDVFDGKIVVWGGIPSVTVLESCMNDYDFEAYMNNLFEEIGSGDKLILSIADATPPDAKFSRILKINQLVQEFGPVK